MRAEFIFRPISASNSSSAIKLSAKGRHDVAMLNQFALDKRRLYFAGIVAGENPDEIEVLLIHK